MVVALAGLIPPAWEGRDDRRRAGHRGNGSSEQLSHRRACARILVKRQCILGAQKCGEAVLLKGLGTSSNWYPGLLFSQYGGGVPILFSQYGGGGVPMYLADTHGARSLGRRVKVWGNRTIITPNRRKGDRGRTGEKITYRTCQTQQTLILTIMVCDIV
jgi:hypothetical protein